MVVGRAEVEVVEGVAAVSKVPATKRGLHRFALPPTTPLRVQRRNCGASLALFTSGILNRLQ